MSRMLSKEKIINVCEKLQREYPDAKCALDHSSPYELLVATMLSAQCTDARVNIVTAELFKHYNTPQEMLKLKQEQLESYIHSCGFYRNKAKNILSMSKLLVENYDGVVPDDKELLQKLPGVGRKTANVVCAVAYGVPGIAVDTHVFRVANRIGIVNEKDELHTELSLMKCITQDKWIDMHHVLINHGRKCCKAQKPLCGGCVISDLCLYKRNVD